MDSNSPFVQIALSLNEYEAKNFLRTSSQHLSNLHYLDHIAEIQSHIKDYEGCIETLSRELGYTQSPQEVYSVKTNLAVIYNRYNDPLKAIDNLDYLLDLAYSPDLELEKGLSFYLLGKYNESEKIMRKLLQLNLPDEFKARVEYNLAIYELEKGDFKTGYFQYIDKGHKMNVWPTQQRAMIPLWKGEIDKNKTLFIHAEGGIGDEIICFRFAKFIKKLGMRVIWKTSNKDLKSVFDRNGVETVLDYSEFEAENVVQCMAMYLPHLLKLDKDDVWFDTYLEADPKYIEKWRKILPNEKKLAVRWRGNTGYEQNLHRTLPVDKLKNLKYDGIKINIQIDEPVDWAINPDIEDIEDTLAILNLCEDGVVTSCTSVVHMAGALGVKTIVCPAVAYYYVWAKGCNWYGDHVKVVRQEKWNDWDSVFEKVQGHLDR